MTAPAVFVRNHDRYLRQAEERPALFRASFHWTGALNLFNEHGPLPAYFCPIPDGLTSPPPCRVAYVGILHAVCVNPGLADLDRLLQEHDAIDTAQERTVPPGKVQHVWNGDCRTLYVATVDLLPATARFPLTELVKLSDGQRLTTDYSYSLVEARS